jgi:cytochrome d ubiquinol oxidase subunit II
MDLNSIWFILIAVLFIGYFFLEGFDYGVGILLPFLGKDDEDRRVIINSIGPFWDGNEVWLLTAGGAMFAAFPRWYATLFSGFYLALVLMLLALIGRGVAFEFRSKDKNPTWRTLWVWLIFVGSFVPALLWGVAIANIVRGVPIDSKMNYVGDLLDLLNPYALVAGLTSLTGFALHGALFLNLRTRGEIAERARSAAVKLSAPAVLLLVVLAILSFFMTDIFTRLGLVPGLIAILAMAAAFLVRWLLRIKRDGWAFVTTGLTIALTTITAFLGLYPRVMVSSLNPAWSLTIYNASSSPYTLTVMTIVALIFVPIVLIYQGWTYWVFRERVGRQQPLTY